MVLKAKAALNAIKDITSKSLEEIDLPGAKFEGELLQCLKYNESESVIELPLSEKRCNAFHAGVIGLNTTWINLQTLNMGYNEIGAEGATALSKNTTWTNLQTLNLEWNSIGEEGATALSHNTFWTHPQTLNMGYNEIGAEGATALSKNTTWTNLQTLNLRDNWIREEGAASLHKNQTWPKNIRIEYYNLEFSPYCL